MQKYYATIICKLEAAEATHPVVYLASEADARLEQLEKALRSCEVVLGNEMRAQARFQHLANAALEEASQALMESGR